MFEDLIPENHEGKIPHQDKDSLIKALKDNINAKEVMILDLIGDINDKQITIDDLTKELDYLRDL